MIVILIGPIQFSNRIRRNWTKLHRISGRIYITAAMILAPMGAYIQWFEESLGTTRSFTVATIIDAFLLMATTGIAFYYILRRKIQLHREWMTRSYACALVFLEVRVIGGLTGWMASETAIETMVWSCVAMALFLAQIVIEVQRSQRPA